MKQVDRKRLTLVALPCGLLAIALFAQALTGILAKPSPALASSIFPGNGMALEEEAYAQFAASATDPEDLTPPARDAQDDARAALAAGPLAPRAYTIMALAADNPQRRDQILSLASTLNRRDLALQALVLEQHLAAGNYRAMLVTLDQMQRVDVRMRQTFFPLMVDALKQPGAEQEFIEILDLSAPWHELFLLFALDDAEARTALASMRSDLLIENPEFDRRLIGRLAAQGELELAAQVYDRLKPADAGQSASNIAAVTGSGQISWAADYPPFDWTLIDESNLRSQPSRDANSLEIFVRSGFGGTVAQRIVAAPPQNSQSGSRQGFVIATALNAETVRRPGAVQIVVTCAANGASVIAAPLENGANRVTIDTLPAGCGPIRLAVNARSRRGEPTLRAELEALTISAR